MNGIVLIDKPCGMTSFHITSKARKKLNQRKIGHAGTLDPMATGVLPIMIGQATKLIDMLPDHSKRYTATFMLGLTTDTLDCTGEVLTDQPVNVTAADVQKVLDLFKGEIMQVPPMYSALQKDGVRLYDLARQGIEVEREPRRADIYSLSLLSNDGDSYTIDVECSRGTYIRTLIDDIGIKLGCGAMMTALHRTYSNGFSINECITLDEFLMSDISESVLSPEYALMDYNKVTVTSAQATRFLNGGGLNLDRVTLPDNCTDFVRVYGNEFIGLGKIDLDDNELKPRCVFSD